MHMSENIQSISKAIPSMNQTSVTQVITSLSESIANNQKEVTLTGEPTLSILDIIGTSRKNYQVSINPHKTVVERNREVLNHMKKQIETGVPMYGVTSAYGGRAGVVLEKNHIYNDAKRMSEAIVHVDVSTGPLISTDIVRAAMLVRINMLLPGYSAVRHENLEALVALLNHHLTPQVGFYGTLGASGDLAHNGRVLSTLLHNPHSKITAADGATQNASEALTRAGIKKIELDPKEGLGLVNGDNFSTAAAALQTYDASRLMVINLYVTALSIQALKGSNRNFHPLLSHVRPHPGQHFVAESLVTLLDKSKLAYQELASPTNRDKDVLIQDGYSIRCLPQFYGPDWEALASIWNTIEINANSVSDNPLWTTAETATTNENPYQWVSGGNFLAMHMVESLDRLRKILIHMVKQSDRHVSRLINIHLNNGLPANLSPKGTISQCVFKGVQTQMGMLDVFASTLASPLSTAFGVHEELNQDLTSHAMTSAYLNQEVFRIAKIAIASNLIASCQAIDLRGGAELLSPRTQPLFQFVRKIVPFIEHEQPLGHYIEIMADALDSDDALALMLHNL